MPDFDFIQEKFQFPTSLEVNFDFGASSFKVLAGQSNIFTAIWASPTASRTSGKLYVASQGTDPAFSILDLDVKILYDRYTTTTKGRANQALKQEDPKDIVI